MIASLKLASLERVKEVLQMCADDRGQSDQNNQATAAALRDRSKKSDSDLVRENEEKFRFCPSEKNMDKLLDDLPPFTYSTIVKYVRCFWSLGRCLDLFLDKHKRAFSLVEKCRVTSWPCPWASDFTCSFTWLLMTFVVNKPRMFGHLLARTTNRNFKFALTYISSFPFTVWKSNTWRFKMWKQKIGGDFNRLECGKTEKTFAGTRSFKKRVEISSSVERMVLHGGSKLEKNETAEADTFIIHDTAMCLHFRLERLLYA